MITPTEASTWIVLYVEDYIAQCVAHITQPISTTSSTMDPFGDPRYPNAMTAEHKWFASSTSEHVHAVFSAYPERWYGYHDLYREARKSWPEIPYARIAKLPILCDRPGLVIADFGCGEALLGPELLPHLQHTVHCYDHVAINDTVVACDLKCVPLADRSVDIVVCSLSLMSLNWTDYIAQAYMVLRVGGYLIVGETNKRWTEYEIDTTITECGFVLGEPIVSDPFVYVIASKMG